jgi:hypothetical protein
MAVEQSGADHGSDGGCQVAGGVPDNLLGMGQRDGSGLERYDRVWCVQWVFPRQHPAELPGPVIETVREVAAGLGVALTDAHGDNHDDIGGGDPRLQVWRFYLRAPDVGQPAGPARDVDALTDHWAMPASAWPVAVLTLAGLIAGLASDAGLTGRVQVDFSPTLTTLERMTDLVRQSYAPQLAALESAFSRFRDTYADTTGRQLPDTLVSARWDQDQGTVVGSAAFYVGEDALRLACRGGRSGTTGRDRVRSPGAKARPLPPTFPGQHRSVCSHITDSDTAGQSPNDRSAADPHGRVAREASRLGDIVGHLRHATVTGPARSAATVRSQLPQAPAAETGPTAKTGRTGRTAARTVQRRATDAGRASGRRSLRPRSGTESRASRRPGAAGSGGTRRPATEPEYSSPKAARARSRSVALFLERCDVESDHR